MWQRSHGVFGNTGVRGAATVTLLTWAAFSWAGGVPGFLIYLGVIAGVTFGIQLVTYLQHWGWATTAWQRRRTDSSRGKTTACFRRGSRCTCASINRIMSRRGSPATGLRWRKTHLANLLATCC